MPNTVELQAANGASSSGLTVRGSTDVYSGTPSQGVFMIPKDQEYFWSPAWQALERQVDEDYAAGDTVTFDSPREVLLWLLEADDDE